MEKLFSKTLVALAFAFLFAVASAETISFKWENATENTDGSPYSNPDKTILRYGLCTDTGTVPSDSERVELPHSTTSFETPDLPPGKYCAWVRHQNAKGERSDLSNIVEKVVADSGVVKVPRAPTNLQVVEASQSYGPVSEATRFDSSPVIKRDSFTWTVTFTLNSTVNSGLVSRDQSGTKERGHLTLRVENGTLILRNQDACGNCGGSGEELRIAHTGIEAETEYVAVIKMDPATGTRLMLDGVEVGSDARSWGLAGNDLPLYLGASCERCNETTGPNRVIDGTVRLDIS